MTWHPQLFSQWIGWIGGGIMNKLAGKVVTKVLETEPKSKLFIHLEQPFGGQRLFMQKFVIRYIAWWRPLQFEWNKWCNKTLRSLAQKKADADEKEQKMRWEKLLLRLQIAGATGNAAAWRQKMKKCHFMIIRLLQSEETDHLWLNWRNYRDQSFCHRNLSSPATALNGIDAAKNFTGRWR